MNNNIKVILASKSPRRQELLKLMDLDFRIVLKEVDESYPDGLTPEEIAVYIARKKAEALQRFPARPGGGIAPRPGLFLSR